MNALKNLTLCFIIIALAYLATDKITEQNLKKEWNIKTWNIKKW